ncbi:GIY-YIG nuclease family protein [Lysinibacillus sp. 3P01SB]|uniref:GIY-YIG nuclease family protein n=1 Tax=Lysinibacillus sp. 3P01SB TaxID=3132284 RepID=UPI0039A4CC72
MFELYMITNKNNGKRYIGFTSEGYLKRFKNHIKEARRGGNRLLCKAIRKYGEAVFITELLEVVESYEEAIKREKELISFYNTFAGDEGSSGYNTTRGGEGSIGHTVPLELRTKLKSLREEEGRWKGNNNPNYRNKLFKNGEHARVGVKITLEGKRKISEANKGRFAGIKHPNAVKKITFAKKLDTGEIIKKNSFYELRTFLEKEFKVKINRSGALKVMRGEARSHNGFIFYRENETPGEIFKEISYQYDNNIKTPIIFDSLNQKETHPNAKNYTSFAKNITTGELLKFNSWYECKQYMTNNINSKFNYSEMKKCLEGKRNYVRGYIFYREDVTDASVFKDLENEYRSFNDYRKHIK